MRLLFLRPVFFHQLTVAIKIEKIQISVTDNGKSSMNEKGGSYPKKKVVVPPAGLEPAIPGLGDRCHIH